MSEEIKLGITLETQAAQKGFNDLERKGDETAKKIGGSFSKRNQGVEKLTEALETTRLGMFGVGEALIRATGPLGALTLAAGTAAVAFGRMAFEGERANAIGVQFENVARSAGLQVDQFTESLIKSTEGLIDDKEALQIATQSIIALGDNAAKIPEILDASRGVSRALGRDFKDTFQSLSTFVETGNARILRQFGLVLDLNRAYEQAAKSIGLTASQLSEQQKQTIRTNLLLEEVPRRFSAAAESVTPLADAFQRLKVSAQQAFGDIEESIANFITKQFIDENDLSNVSFNRLTKQLEQNQKEINAANARLEQLRATPQAELSFRAGAEIKSLTNQIELLKAQNERLAVQASGLSDAQLFADLEASRNAPAAAAKETLKLDEAQIKLLAEQNAKRRQELQNFLVEQEKLNVEAENKRIAGLTDSAAKEAALKAQFTQQQILLEQQKNQALEQVDKQFGDKFSESEREQARLAVLNNFYLQEQALAKQNADAIKAINEEKNLSLFNSDSAFFAGFEQAAESFRNKAGETFKQIGKQAFDGIGRGVAGAFAAYGSALKNGEDANKAFLDSTLKFFGDLAVNIGSYYVALGAAKLFGTPADKADALPLIAAGSALAVLGGVLGASGGSKAQAQTGGGIAAEPSTTTEFVPPEQAVTQEANTNVQVVIQGDVLDSDQSSIRIVELINSAFDKQGVVVQRGAFA